MITAPRRRAARWSPRLTLATLTAASLVLWLAAYLAGFALVGLVSGR